MTQFAIAIPQTMLDAPLDPRRLQAFLRRAEQLNFDSAWAIEQVVGHAPVLESLTTLAYAAAATERLKLGVAVLILNLRQPTLLAKQLTSIDVLSQGRLIVGIGLGGLPVLYPAFGVDSEARVARFLESLKVMQLLWTEERATLDGRFTKLKNIPMQPKPIQKPHPPLWFGGHHPDALRRAVTLGDGFMGAGSSPIPTYLEELKQVQELLKENPRPFTLGKRVYLAIDSDHERARTRLRRWFEAFYRSADLADQVAVWGTADEIAHTLLQLQAAGTQYFMLHPVFDEEEHLELLATDVIPRVSAMSLDI